MRRKLTLLGVVLMAAAVGMTSQAQTPPGSAAPTAYVGAKKCGECHDEQYQRYRKFSKKAHSYQSIVKMERGLTPEEKVGCYRCHTTAYGRTGGFVSQDKTPDLGNVGCEACHGPGGRHVKSEAKKDIRRKAAYKLCLGCHVSERIKAFQHAPLTYGGAH